MKEPIKGWKSQRNLRNYWLTLMFEEVLVKKHEEEAFLTPHLLPPHYVQCYRKNGK